MKRILSVFLTLALIAGVFPLTELRTVTKAFAAEVNDLKPTPTPTPTPTPFPGVTPSAADFKFDSSTGTITGYVGSGKNLEIPSIINGVNVTRIGQYAFYNCSGLTSITIPSSVTSIAQYAFSICSGLTSITIPSSVTSIGDSAFDGCSGLTSITIPSSVTSIGNSAFCACSGLTSMSIPSSVTNIGDKAFAFCSGLTSITIPSSVTSIGDYAFSGCSALTSITIPSSVKGIGDYAFYNCSSLTSITIPSSVTSIGDYAFYFCSGLTSITIPNSVAIIGQGAFRGCSGLTSMSIPSSVTNIGDSAFSGCSGLTSITIPSSVTNIGESVFSFCSGLTSVTIPSSVTNIGESAFSFCNGLTSITMPSSVTNIDQYAFSGCGLTSITIPSSVTSIGQCVFGGCSGLTSITIPSSVTSIGDIAFSCCYNLTIYTSHDSEADKYAKSYSIPVNYITPTPVLNSVTPSTVTYDARKLPLLSVTLCTYNDLTDVKNGTISLVAGKDYTVSGSTLSIAPGYFNYYFNKFPNQDLKLVLYFSAGNTATLTVHPFWEQIPVITTSEVKIDKTKISDVSVSMELYGNTLTSINNGTAALNPACDYSISGNTVTIKKSYINYYFSKFPNQNLNIIFKFSDGYDRILTLYTGDSPNTAITPTVVTYKVGSKADVAVTAIMNGNFFSSINNGTSQLVPRVDYTYAVDTNTLILRSSYMAYYFSKFNQDLVLIVNFTGGKPVALTIKPVY